jgi:hypothetical protein
MAQQYLLPCPACGAKTPVDTRQAGETITCSCGNKLSVPTLRGLRELERSEDAAPSAPVRAKKWSPVQGLLFSFGLLVAILCGAMATRHFVAYRSLAEYTIDRTEEVDKDFEQIIDNLTLTSSLEAWEDLSKSGLSNEMVPTWVAAQQASAHHVRAMTIWGAIAAVGLMSVAVALVMGRAK